MKRRSKFWMRRDGCSRESLQAVAAINAAKARKDAFGPLTHVGELTGNLNQLSEKRAALYAEIESSYTATDLDATSERVTFRDMPDVVLGGPQLAERLCNTWIAQGRKPGGMLAAVLAGLRRPGKAAEAA